MRRILISVALAALASSAVFAQDPDAGPLKEQDKLETPETNPEVSEDGSLVDSGPMTILRMAEIIKALDENATIVDRGAQLTIAGVRITIVADPKANRMRAFSAFKTLDGVDGQQLYRMMQANFDAALDARYAVAKGHVLSVFIHPLAELRKDQLIEALGQVVNLVKTFGTAYTSGAMTFGGGDSRNLHRELIDELLKKGKEI